MKLSKTTIPALYGNDPSSLVEALQGLRDRRLDVLASQERVRFVMDDEGPRLDVFLDKMTEDATDGILRLRPTDRALDQIAEKVGLPRSYFQKCGETEGMADLLAENVNRWLRHDGEKRRLVRGLRLEDGTLALRALLSDRYRVLDHHDVALTGLEAAVQALDEQDAGSPECFGWNLSERRLDVLLIATGIVADLKAGEVAGDVDVDHGKGRSKASSGRHLAHSGDLRGTLQDPAFEARGTVSRMATAEGNDGSGGEGADLVYAGVRIVNSETGDGGLRIYPTAFRNVCSNRLMLGYNFSQIHLGKTLNADVLFSDETRRKESALVYDKVRDTVRATFSRETFDRLVSRLRESKTELVADPVKAIDVVAKAEGLTESRRDAILALYKREASPEVDTVFDVVQAITASAHGVRDANPDEAFEIEAIGSKVLQSPPAAILV